MQIACFEVEKWEENLLKSHCPGFSFQMVKDPLTAQNAAAYSSAEIVSCFVYSDLGLATLDHFPNLKFIATRSTGFDHIDLEACHQRKIRVANVPSYGAHTVAEHAFALLLSLSRRVVEAVNRTKQGQFSLTGLQGFDLHGKTLGVIGVGRIGFNVIQIARAFGMHVVAYDIQPRPDVARQHGFAYVTLVELLAKSDVISLHTPGGPQTRHLLSEKEFARMKQGVVILNTARGSVMDAKALLRALESGKVAAAGLDVLLEERALKHKTPPVHEEDLHLSQELVRHPRVIVTPHSAFYTTEAVEKILKTTAENIEAFLKGKPQNLVNQPF